jgi:hypothetical protein
MKTLAIFLFATSLAACSADGVGMDPEVGPDAGEGIKEGVPLEIEAPAPSTKWSSIPVTGHGPPNGTLYITTGAGGQISEQLPASGKFCVDVVLAKNTVNTIKFEAIDTTGEYSDPVLIDVTQDGDPPDANPNPEPQPGYSNIALNANISAHSVSVEEGELSALVDGDSTGAVSLTDAPLSLDWLVIDLKERLPIEQFHIETTEDCPLEEYDILLHDGAESGNPVGGAFSTPGEGWTVVASMVDGSSDETLEPALGSPKARRMAIHFLSDDCGSFGGRHKITEIEVWGRGESTPEEPKQNNAPSCTSL